LQTTGTIARRIALLVVLALTFTASAMITIYALFQTGEVKVPNVVGMSQDDAERAIERAGLQFKLRRQHFDTEAPAGLVTEQDPAAGFPVKVGFDIKVDVSKGTDPTGKSEEPPPPGPTNPVEGPVENANTNKKKVDKNKNGNLNANANTNTTKNANTGTNTNKNADGKGVKTDEPGAVKPKDGDKKKPEADIPPKPKPKPAPQVPPHD
jgi:serine/threonine-protein kinase